MNKGIYLEKGLQPCPDRVVDLNGEFRLTYQLTYKTKTAHTWANVFRITGGTGNATGPNDR